MLDRAFRDPQAARDTDRGVSGDSHDARAGLLDGTGATKQLGGGARASEGAGRPLRGSGGNRRETTEFQVEAAASQVDAANVLPFLPNHLAAVVGGDEGRIRQVRVARRAKPKLECATVVDDHGRGIQVTATVVGEHDGTAIDCQRAVERAGTRECERAGTSLGGRPGARQALGVGQFIVDIEGECASGIDEHIACQGQACPTCSNRELPGIDRCAAGD